MQRAQELWNRWSYAALLGALAWGLCAWLVLPRVVAGGGGGARPTPGVVMWHQVLPVILAAGLTVGLLMRAAAGWGGRR